jgi:small-conductance mechanosensitive channel
MTVSIIIVKFLFINHTAKDVSGWPGWQAGPVTGQVVEMGIHSTLLLNTEKFPIIVPNSFFSSQVLR